MREIAKYVTITREADLFNSVLAEAYEKMGTRSPVTYTKVLDANNDEVCVSSSTRAGIARRWAWRHRGAVSSWWGRQVPTGGPMSARSRYLTLEEALLHRKRTHKSAAAPRTDGADYGKDEATRFVFSGSSSPT